LEILSNPRPDFFLEEEGANGRSAYTFNPKRHERTSSMKKLALAFSVLAMAALTAACASDAGKAPGSATSPAAAGQPKVLKENIKTVTATVESVNLTTREVTLRGPDGKLRGVKVGEEVKNLPQVKAGDKVQVTYYESIAAQIMQRGSGPATAAQQAAATAKPGEKPAGAVAQQVATTATVEAIDKANQLVTLKGPKGNTVEVKVNDPKNLEKVKVGDEIAIVYTEALAISVEPAAK
jgi:Cu/Ag efflux protein CusF